MRIHIGDVVRHFKRETVTAEQLEFDKNLYLYRVLNFAPCTYLFIVLPPLNSGYFFGPKTREAPVKSVRNAPEEFSQIQLSLNSHLQTYPGRPV